MYPDGESSEEHPNSFYQDGSYDDSEDIDDSTSGKGCLIFMVVILIPAGYLPAAALSAVSIFLLKNPEGFW